MDTVSITCSPIAVVPVFVVGVGCAGISTAVGGRVLPTPIVRTTAGGAMARRASKNVGQRQAQKHRNNHY
jgi:hypothetical protein